MADTTTDYSPAGELSAGGASLVGTILRYPIALAVAITVTLGLFFGMQLLITSGKDATEGANEFRLVDTRIPPEETDVVRKERKPPKPEDLEEPPEPPEIDQANNVKPDSGGTNLKFDFAGDTNLEGGISFETAADREVLPIVRVEPVYPTRAASRGLEGFVMMEFTVLASGAVDPESIEVIESEPSSVFNRAAIRAVRKWKYKPKIENGKPVDQFGIRTLLTFQLAN
ncbi:MAG: energy transducer TonB [Pseudomonadota bacterium]